MCDLQHTPHARQLVCEITYDGWSDNGPIAGDPMNPINTRYNRFKMTLLPYYKVLFIVLTYILKKYVKYYFNCLICHLI